MFSSISDKTFEPEDMVVLDRAFRQACSALVAAKDERLSGARRAAFERQLAKVILEIAQAGETSPDRLAASTLERFNRP